MCDFEQKIWSYPYTDFKPADTASIEVADNIYVRTGIGTGFKINNLLKLFKLYNADAEDPVFYLKNQEEKSSGDA